MRDPAQLPALPAVISQPRLATYAQAATQAEAVRLYSWNISVASAFWGPLHVLEVCLRNAVSSQLANHAGQSDWWESPGLLVASEYEFVPRARGQAQKNHTNLSPAQITPGHILAELSFAFWVSLFSNKTHQRLWVNAGLRNVFPSGTHRAKEVHGPLEGLRVLRNRVAHHEPLITRDLVADEQSLNRLAAMINFDSALWIASHSRISEVVAARRSAVDGTSTVSF